MNKHLFTVAFLLGALAVAWAGAGFIDSSFLALAVTAVIGAVYLFGALELHRFRQATGTLTAALADVPADLADLGTWLARVHPSLQNPVRLRVEGERAGLPGPALAPYLAGLLVMLGMLGTFLGLVVTLKGTVFALEKSADLEAMRSALAVPVAGLGLAFGTSIAGVAASAMLGLMSALSRRERLQASQLLDGRIATALRGFSLSHQRQETYKALQLQARALPEVVDKLHAMMVQMEGMSRQLNQRLLANQEDFHANVKEAYTGLADAVSRSLQDNLSSSAHAAGERIRPVLEAAVNNIARESQMVHMRMADTVQMQLDALSARLVAATDTVTENWTAALKTHEKSSAGMVSDIGRALDACGTAFEQRSAALVANIGEAYAGLQRDHAEQDRQRQQAWTQSLQDVAAALTRELQHSVARTLDQQQQLGETWMHAAQGVSARLQDQNAQAVAETGRLVAAAEELMRSRIAAEALWLERHEQRTQELTGLLQAQLGGLRADEAARGEAAVARLGQLQEAVAAHLTTLGAALEEPLTRLIQASSEAPRAAAEVIAQLREQISANVTRDNALLEERSRIMDTLNGLLAAINHATGQQREVIDALVASSAEALGAAAQAFSGNVASESAKLADVAAHVTSSAVDVASLSEAFGFAVNTFSDANEKLIGRLQGIEDAMSKSMARSDDQLAYYVAQAREIIDLSMTSQKEIFEELRRLAPQHVTFAQEGR